MGCCFSKELNPGLQSERTGLLQSSVTDGLAVREQDRRRASAVAHHVCLVAEHTCIPDGPSQQKTPEAVEMHTESVVPNKVRTGSAGVSGDSTAWSERDLKPASAHEEEQAIIIAPSMDIHTHKTGETGVTHTAKARASCESAPYMEVSTQSPVKQKIMENAVLRATWFNQHPAGHDQEEAVVWGTPPVTVAPPHCLGDTGAGGVSDTKPPPVSVCQGMPRNSLGAKHEDEEEEAGVIRATLGQGFGARAQSFYSICSVDADDLDLDQSQPAGAVTVDPFNTAEPEAADLSHVVEPPVSGPSHTVESKVSDQSNIAVSTVTNHSHVDEPNSIQSHPTAPTSTIQLQTTSIYSPAAKHEISPELIVSSQQVDPLPDLLALSGNRKSSEDPLASSKDSSATPGDAVTQPSPTDAKVIDNATPDILEQTTSHRDESVCVEEERSVCVEEKKVFVEKSEFVEGERGDVPEETVLVEEERTIAEESVHSESVCEEKFCLEEHSVFSDEQCIVAMGVLLATPEKGSDGCEEKEDLTSVQRTQTEPPDSVSVDCHPRESDHTVERHTPNPQPTFETPELFVDFPSTSNLSPNRWKPNPDFSLPDGAVDGSPQPGENTEMQDTPTRSPAASGSVGRGLAGETDKEDDTSLSSTVETTLTDVSSVSTLSALSSLPIELTACSYSSDLTPQSDIPETKPHQFNSSTSDTFNLKSNSTTFEFSCTSPSREVTFLSAGSDERDVKLDECNPQPDQIEVKPSENDRGPGESAQVEPTERGDAFPPRVEEVTEEPEAFQEFKQGERGNSTIDSPQTGHLTSHLTGESTCNETGENCLSFHDSGETEISPLPQGSEDLESSHVPEGPRLSPLTGSHHAEGEVSTSRPSSPPHVPPPCYSSSTCTDTEGGDRSLSCANGVEPTDTAYIQIQMTAVTSNGAHPEESDDMKTHVLPEESSEPVSSGSLDTFNNLSVEIPAESREHAEAHVGCGARGTDRPPIGLGYRDDSAPALDCHEGHAMVEVDPDQIDMFASTPSYEIHFLGQRPAAAAGAAEVRCQAEEGERDGGMREMVSELLGEEADSSLSRLYPNPWIKLGLEEGCGGWAQGACEAEPSKGDRETCSKAEQIPVAVSELQPSMALLGAYPYSTLMPQGSCVWDWHTEYAQSVSIGACACVCLCVRVCRTAGLSS